MCGRPWAAQISGVMERTRDAGVGGHGGRLDDSVLGGS